MEQTVLSIHQVNPNTMKNPVVKKNRSGEEDSLKLSLLAAIVITFGFVVYHVLNTML